MCAVLTMLKQTGKKMSQLVAPMKRYVQSGEINFTIEDKDGTISPLRKEFGPAGGWNAAIDELDGVTIDCFDKPTPKVVAPGTPVGGWWCNVRKSNTEPLLRLNLEAKDKRTLDTILARISPMLGVRVDH